MTLRAPAVCDSCGTFFPSGYEVDNSRNISFSGCVSGPCPKCGGSGHVPDGVYNFIDNTIELLSAPERTLLELECLASILKQARQEEASLDQIGKKIQDAVPELSSLKDILPKSRSELYVFVGIIITVIGLVLGQFKRNENEPHVFEVNQVVNIINQQQGLTAATGLGWETTSNIQSEVTREIKKEIGRNDVCPCGSGKKYKNCCIGNE